MISQRILTAGGLLLFLLSATSGLYYDIVLRPEQQAAVSYTFDMALNMAVKGDPAMAAAFAGEFASRSSIQDIQSRLPQHLAYAGAAALAPVVLATKLAVSQRMERVLALLIIAGGLLLGIGDIVQLVGNMQLGRYLVFGGYTWIVLGLAGYALYSILFIWLSAAPQSKRR